MLSHTGLSAQPLAPPQGYFLALSTTPTQLCFHVSYKDLKLYVFICSYGYCLYLFEACIVCSLMY